MQRSASNRTAAAGAQHTPSARRSILKVALGLALFGVGCSSGGTEVSADAGATGSCTTNTDCASDGPTSICCGGVCVDSSGDVAHCGACAPCPSSQHGRTSCVAGACVIASCDPGYADCDKQVQTGCEEQTDTAAENCGACGNKCSIASGVAACEAGACVVASCNTGRADCNGMASDGCEVDLRSDVAHCGTCSNACTAAGGADVSCVAAVCHTGACKTGFADCDGSKTNGCEVDVTTDAANCGSCGTSCAAVPHATNACKAGVCGVGTCDTGYADCDGVVWNGCETSIATDPANCGMCGRACGMVSGGSLTCTSGACSSAVCSVGFADCDTTASNGCEVTLASDASNCGVCGNACPTIANGTAGCASFVCGIGACNTGYADCFGGKADGCETSILDSADNCGGCGTACPAVANGTRACAMGACRIGSCATGYADCDMRLDTGCESLLASDANNCGACGTVCPKPTNGAAACAASACGLGTCDTGWANCNSDATDGCERDVTSDPANCGGCGIVCGSGTCTAGACVCSKNVLILRDDSTTGAATLATALTTAGYTVTTSSVPSYQYNGTNPALTAFGSVIVLAGGPSATSYTTDMPAAGQTALLNFANTGHGIVLTEWAAYHVASGRWSTLAPLVLLTRNSTYGGSVSAVVEPARSSHPIWAGLPSTFSFSGNVNVGTAKSGSFISVLATSPEALDLVVTRDAPTGRVVHFGGAGNYAPNGWTNANLQKLMVNAAGWAARCN